jgi:hypothetical protein
LIGSGDYVANDLVAGSNTVMMPMSLSKDKSNHQTIRVQHREYITDLRSLSAVDFNTQVINVNPADSTTFPWLSNLASNFEQYKMHGLAFEFVSSTSEFYQNSGMGTIMIGAQYDLTSPVYTSKRIMENSDEVISFRPDKNAVYGVECKGQMLGKYTTREASIPPTNFSDFIRLVIGYNTPITPVLGELWAVYDVELYRPIITNIASNPVDSFLHAQQAVSDLSWSTTPVFSSVSTCGLSLMVAGTGTAKQANFTLNGVLLYDVFQVRLFFNKSTASSASGYTLVSTTGCSTVADGSSALTYENCPDTTVSCAFSSMIFCVQATTTGTMSFVISNANGVYNGRCDLWVTRIINPGAVITTI